MALVTYKIGKFLCYKMFLRFVIHLPDSKYKFKQHLVMFLHPIRHTSGELFYWNQVFLCGRAKPPNYSIPTLMMSGLRCRRSSSLTPFCSRSWLMELVARCKYMNTCSLNILKISVSEMSTLYYYEQYSSKQNTTLTKQLLTAC